MPRGPKKHLKRLNAPKHWMLDKLGGVFAPKPSPGPHKQRECLPLCLIMRNRLKYALTYKAGLSSPLDAPMCCKKKINKISSELALRRAAGGRRAMRVVVASDA